MTARGLRDVVTPPAAGVASVVSGSRLGVRGPFRCPACGRMVAVRWPVRSVLCRCGTSVLSPQRAIPSGV